VAPALQIGEPRMIASADVVIIGAGLAGAATAYSLTRLSDRTVVVLEQEEQPGLHSSGRNAAMIRHVIGTRALMPVVSEGARFVRRPPSDFPAVSYNACGSLILAEGAQADALRRAVREARALGIAATWLDREQVISLTPFAAAAHFQGAARCDDDGVVDVAALLQGYLSTAVRHGARLFTGLRVTGIRVNRGRVYAVETNDGCIRATAIVNAAGAWCRRIGRLAGAIDPPLRSARRHLMATGPLPSVDARGPIIWDESHGLYFRPESGGLLLSPCDEDDHEPGD
jgi:D-arginine dehydrogenase